LDLDDPDDLKKAIAQCPYGLVGDRLWVRETVGLIESQDTPIGWECVGMIPVSKIKPESDRFCSFDLVYRATSNYEKSPGERWTPAIHMPRWASRITLEITGIWVERLQDISINDCISEGITDSSKLRFFRGSGIEKQEYCLLWDKLNSDRGYSWESNPWVWVIVFKRIP
jgi:hypothetical protein